MEMILLFLSASWSMLVVMAPYLLLGFFFAGLLSVVISAEWAERHLGRRGMGQVLKAGIFGVPLPLCSCGVLPVAASLRRHGAGRGAVTAFLLSTPQTGVDSIALTWVLLGPFLALLRPVAAFFSGVLGGGLVEFFDHEEGKATAEGAAHKSCCGAKTGEVPEGQDGTAPSGSCCSRESPRSRLLRALEHAFVVLPRDLGRALVIGILLSGLISAFLRPEMLHSAGLDGWTAYLTALVIGIPLYVCATASTPIAASLIAAGLSPGAALVFLISGPATNFASLATLLKILGRRAVALYLLTVVLTSLGTGLLVDFLLGFAPKALKVTVPLIEAGPESRHFGFGEFSAVVLLLMLIPALLPFSGHRDSPSREAGGNCCG